MNTHLALKDKIKEEAYQALTQAWTQSTESDLFLRLELPVQPTPLIDWLEKHEQTVRMYWQSRDHQFEIVALGYVERLEARSFPEVDLVLSTIQSRLNPQQPHLRYYGGLRFPTRLPNNNSPWKSFEHAVFILPQIELYRQDTAYFLAFNLSRGPSASLVDLKQKLEQLLNRLEASRPLGHSVLPELGPPEFTPDYPEWLRQIHEAQTLFSGNKLKKIVLARQAHYALSQEIQPLSILKALTKNPYPAFVYFFQFEAGKAFLGASPERLYLRQNQQIYTEAVAGTRALAPSFELNQALKQELLNSQKDLSEHQLVAEHLSTELNKLCLAVQNSPLEVIQTSHVQHLYQGFQGDLKSEVTDTQILQNLHPTPAVGGSPQKEAIKQLDALEGFERGWYSAPIGWIGLNASEFAVALRCALLHPRAMYIFAGAGIVPESIAAQEWQEINLKTQTLLNFFHPSPLGV